MKLSPYHAPVRVISAMLHTKSNDKFRADKAAVSCCGWAVFMGCCIGSTKVGARDVVRVIRTPETKARALI